VTSGQLPPAQKTRSCNAASNAAVNGRPADVFFNPFRDGKRPWKSGTPDPALGFKTLL